MISSPHPNIAIDTVNRPASLTCRKVDLLCCRPGSTRFADEQSAWTVVQSGGETYAGRIVIVDRVAASEHVGDLVEVWRQVVLQRKLRVAIHVRKADGR